MTPWQKAKAWWDENTTDETFEENLGWHFSHGVVHSSPEAFMLAHEVHWDAEREEIADDDRAPNAWFVELAASAGTVNPVRECMRIVPHAQQWALWCRHNSFEIKAHDWAKLSKKVRL